MKIPALTEREKAEKISLSFWGWLLQRVSGIIIIFWSVLHVYSIYLLSLGPEEYESEIALYHNIPLYILLYYMLGIIIGFHAFMGISIIYNDIRRKRRNNHNEMGSNVSYWFSLRYKVGMTKYAWILRRVSGILLIALVAYHITRIHLILGESYYTDWYKVIKAGYGSIESLLIYLFFIFILSYHGSDGLRVIIIDFIGLESGKKLTILSLLIGSIFFIIASIIAIKLFLLSHEITLQEAMI